MIQIRAMEIADVAEVAQIEKESFSQPWSEQDFEEMLAADYAYYYVAEENGIVIGCCGVRDIAGEGEITNVEVAPLYRRQRVGRKLLEFTLQEATKLGIKECTLEVRVSNQPAIRLYESLGFHGEGIRPDFYEQPKEDALIMWKR